MKTLKDVAENLRSIRKEKQWTQAEMAAAADIARVTVARMETQASKDMSLQAVLNILNSAGYELKVSAKGKRKPGAEKVLGKGQPEAVRRYLALVQPRLNVSPLQLEFPYNWSNPDMPDDTLIRKVLDKGRFHDLAVICKKYGLAHVRELAADQLSSSPSLQRSFANIEQGFANARAKHTA
jgi:transcriptional regulator with XRE-family HTH domain